jgi:putative phosphonate catabolism associated alcohol dehydrogenase
MWSSGSNTVNVVFRCLDEPLDVVQDSLPIDIPEGCVLVKMEAATICGSDLHTYQGRRKEATPLVLGHEGVGHVVLSRRASLHAGTRVTWSIADSCLHCRVCKELEMPQKCTTALMKYGHSREPLTGCYASHILLRPGTEIIPVPASLPAGVVAPVNCALATVFAALEHLKTPETVLIQGAGLLGIYAALILKQRGTSTVYIRDPMRKRLDTAAKFGATPVDEVPEGSCDAAIEVCGASKVVTEGLKALRVAGTYVWVGMVTPESQLPITGEQVVRKCLTVRGVHNYGPKHLREAVEFISSLSKETVHLLNTELIAPRVFLLKDLEEAFHYAMNAEYCRVMISC